MQTGEKLEFLISEEHTGRLDSTLAFLLQEEASRSIVQNWIKKGAVNIKRADGSRLSKVKASTILRKDDRIFLTVPQKTKEYSLEPYELEIPILYEDDELAVIIKPAGLAVHPGPGHPDKTLVNALIYNLKGTDKLSSGSEPFRPGIVNRLDLPTYGLMPVAKNDKAHRLLSASFAERKIGKYYKAITVGHPPADKGEINGAIGRHPVLRHKMCIREDGKEAKTLYKLLHSWTTKDNRIFSFLDLQILTGRTHQIRVHLHSIGCSIIGDSFYSRNYRKYASFGLLLACTGIDFTHPISGKELSFNIDIPQNFKDFLQKKSANYIGT